MECMVDRFKLKQAITFSLLFVGFLILVLPRVALYTQSQIGVEESPDMLLFYGKEEFYSMLEAYGQSGRNLYVLLRWTFDLIWPLVYGLFLLATIGYLAKDFQKNKQKKLLVSPLLAVGFDYLENILASIHMLIYPNRIEFLVPVLNLVSILKWGFLVLGFFIFFGLLMYNLFRIITAKRNKK